jgi:hypothetical protein
MHLVSSQFTICNSTSNESLSLLAVLSSGEGTTSTFNGSDHFFSPKWFEQEVVCSSIQDLRPETLIRKVRCYDQRRGDRQRFNPREDISPIAIGQLVVA